MVFFGPSAVLGALVLGYVLGSIPFGLIIAFLSGAGDVRKIGSGNIGATNVLRTGKRWAAVATLLGDGLKGALAVMIASRLILPASAIFAGLGAVLGHIYPVWLKFKGGKGVATFIGVAAGLSWPVALLTGATWLIAALLWRISSLSALIAIALSPAYFLLFGQSRNAAVAAILALLIFFAHRENIRRLLSGREPRIGAGRGT
ncbi:MAG: glycerol-3-phosphate 1-O-acyltransferase PlsY [Rhizomicrobium sp.]